MASNLNKAFMRAYAKDRSATAGDAADAPMPTTAPVVAPTVTATTPGQSTAAMRPGPVAQPSMEPTVFAGRYAPPQVVTPQPAVARAQVAQTSTPQPPTANPHVAPAATAPARPAAASTHRIPAPSLQANNVAPPVRVVSAAPRTTAPASSQQPSSTRIETVQETDNGEATRVWQRIDAAHGTQALHPTETQARPTVPVGTTRSTAPKRMQAAAAAPAPVAPTMPASPLRVDAPAQPGARPMPLVGDEVNPTQDPQPSESRRRTVADFLYAAGQYNPGRVLASAEGVEVPVASATTATSTAPLRTSEMVRPMDSMTEATVMNHQSLGSVQSASPAAMPSQSYAPAIEEPMPRRMGQILRVDVPRGQSAATAMPAAPAASPRQPLPTQPMQPPMPQPAPMQSVAVQSAAMQSAMPVTTTSSMFGMAQSNSPQALDAPVAKYVLEQRRMDRAHQLNEAEDKLRRNTHKIFNPVWEVDNLQWPVVVDKLMQQRAQSMSHVAEHMKTACQDGLSVLGVTSACQGEGRTTVACCLARLAAAHGLNVALVDIDLDHPTLCVQTNMEVEHDWRDCLSEDVSLEEVAVHSIDDQLTVLPLKPRGGRPGLLASDSRIADILADLSESFELVIVDCSKTSSSGNVITGLAHTKIFDAAIVVVDRRDSEADRVEDAVRMIQQTGIESIGIVDNFSM